MQELLVSGRTLTAAYHASLTELALRAPVVPCPDYQTEQKEASMTMYVEEPLAEPMISKLFTGGPKELEQYRQEILYGILDFEIERGKWAYTYHSRMAEQKPFILRELQRNPWSRRAVLDIRDWRRDARDGNDSPAGLQHIQYLIREDKLHCKVLFRSSDACKASFRHAFGLIMLQEDFARQLGVGVGSYTQRTNSYHCYAKDFDILDSYVRRINSAQDIYDVAYDYQGDGGWQEVMEMYQPEIAALVETLKNR